MKRLLLIVLPLLLIVGCSNKEELIPLVVRYEEDKRKQVSYINYYKKTGNKIEKVKSESYSKGGDLEYEYTYKDGKRDGLYTSWYNSGKVKGKGTYKVGEQDGLWTWWYENGQIEVEKTYKDGEGDGLWTWWYENGQKKKEGIYMDGGELNPSSIKCWDEVGNECECGRIYWDGSFSSCD